MRTRDRETQWPTRRNKILDIDQCMLSFSLRKITSALFLLRRRLLVILLASLTSVMRACALRVNNGRGEALAKGKCEKNFEYFLPFSPCRRAAGSRPLLFRLANR